MKAKIILSDIVKTIVYAVINYIIMASLVVILYILPIPIMKWFDIIDQCAKLSPFIIYSSEIIILGMLGFCGYAIFLMVKYKIKKAKKKKRKKNKRSGCGCDKKFRRT